MMREEIVASELPQQVSRPDVPVQLRCEHDELPSGGINLLCACMLPFVLCFQLCTCDASRAARLQG